MIQLSLMIETHRKMLNYQSTEYFAKLQLIEVVKMTMLLMQFVSRVNSIQMRSIKVIHNTENISNQKSQHRLESKWIEVMNAKILPIQFVSIVNLVQMSLKKMIYKMKKILNK
jgi:hypothetical protein